MRPKSLKGHWQYENYLTYTKQKAEENKGREKGNNYEKKKKKAVQQQIVSYIMYRNIAG
jgi:hypothetical protein